MLLVLTWSLIRLASIFNEKKNQIVKNPTSICRGLHSYVIRLSVQKMTATYLQFFLFCIFLARYCLFLPASASTTIHHEHQEGDEIIDQIHYHAVSV